MIFTYKQLATLNDTEKLIYQYTITNLDRISNISIRDFAKETHVSTATILRYCYKLGCNGFVEFKLKLRIYQEKSMSQTTNNETDVLLEFFKYASQESFKEKLDELADYIDKSKRVSFLGIGTSGFLAQYSARYLSNIGYYSNAIIDPYYPPPVDDIDTLLIVLSESGETREVIDQIRLYQMINAKVAVITNNPLTTIDRISDLSIYYYVIENILPQTYNVTSQVPVIHIVEEVGRLLQKRKNRSLPQLVTSRNL